MKPFFNHLHHLFVEFDARPRIGGGVLHLCLAEVVCFPVRELLALAYLLSEDVGIEFLQTYIHDTHLSRYVLQLNECSCAELFAALQSPQVIVPGKTYLRYSGVLEQLDETLGKADAIEAEQEADGATLLALGGAWATHLQERDLVLFPLRERRSRLSIEPEDRLLQEELHSSLCLTLADDDLDAPWEEHSRQVREKRFIVFVKYLFQLLMRI